MGEETGIGPGRAFVVQGDAWQIPLPDRCVQTVITSPPYWGLRKYVGLQDSVWGGDPVCPHQWATEDVRVEVSSSVHWQHTNGGGTRADGSFRNRHANEGAVADDAREWHTVNRGFCTRCGAWKGSLGLEPTPELFVRHLVEVFTEVWRVLRDDGTVWLNLGDCYAHDTKWGGATGGKHVTGLHGDTGVGRQRTNTGLKPKDLVGIPWRVAFALQAAGWYLRSDIIWAKGLSFCATYAGSVMPESVVDRPTRGHEYLFLLTKSAKYYWNPVAAKEPGTWPAGTRAAKGSGAREGNRRGGLRKEDADPDRQPSSASRTQAGGFQDRWDAMAADGYATYSGYRNLRDVWAIGTRPYTEAHFATFPPGLVIPCLQIGSAPWACAACHAPYIQVLDQEPIPPEVQAQFDAARLSTVADTGRTDGHTQRKPNYVRKVTGDHWEPTCACDTPDTEFQIVLDPFGGSGTVGSVAQRLGRYGISLDLSQEYGQLARRRCGLAGPVPAEPASELESDPKLEEPCA